MDEAVQFGPDGEAENVLGDCSEHSRHADGWTTADAAAVERHEAMVVSSALAEASNTTVLTKPISITENLQVVPKHLRKCCQAFNFQ